MGKIAHLRKVVAFETYWLMAHKDYKLYIVDDDANMRAALMREMRLAGFRSVTYASAEAFLADCRVDEPAVLILDLRMPGMDGLALQRMLAERGLRLPVIVISGAADVASAVAAMRLGAIDFIEKPFASRDLVERIEFAILRHDESRERELRIRAAELRLAGLTATERRILGLLSAGHSTKAIALRLGVSVRTVDSHRLSIKRKTRAKSLPELIGLGMLGMPAAGGEAA